ncbi:arginine repressor [Lacticigenium naphthae]|uniref:arginine repressor n=1 Tax=Lacticigenium naphthae TaxID=515351 RepID=UPI0004867786|nr:arginine repressor [Lacticigenium naphthae]
MKKEERQTIIKQIILNNVVSTQEELMNKLREKGISATQATISRDVKELHLVKTPLGDGSTKYTIFLNNQITLQEKLQATLQEVVIDLKHVQFTNLIKTIPSNAHVIGAILDDLSRDEIIGTVAGNDTILILSKDEADAKQLYDYLVQYINL